MVDGINILNGLGQQVRLAQVAFDDPQIKFGQVRRASGVSYEHRDFMATPNQIFRQPTANKTARAGDQGVF